MVNLTAYNIAIVFFAATGGFTYGFGFGVFVPSIGQPGFYKYFDLNRKQPSLSSTAVHPADT